MPPGQEAPSGLFASAGQLARVPLHTSARSHGPLAGRQMVPAAALASLGQAALVPLHSSVRSHGPVAARQTVPAAAMTCRFRAAAWPARRRRCRRCWCRRCPPRHLRSACYQTAPRRRRSAPAAADHKPERSGSRARWPASLCARTCRPNPRGSRLTVWDAGLEQKIAALTHERLVAAMRRHLDPAKLTVIKAGDFTKTAK